MTARRRAQTALFAFASLMLIAGGAVHAAAFGKASLIIDASSMPAFFIGTYKALWLGDSTNLFVLGLLYFCLALRPSDARPPLVIITALSPLATAFLIYGFIGPFFAAHLLVLVWASATAAALLGRVPELPSSLAPSPAV